MQTLNLTPIGVLHCALATKVQAPRQPAAAQSLQGIIELRAGAHFEHALQDLAGWERIWVIFWFHRNAGWRPKVLPPRSTSGRKGVFSTRAPHRPNPLGLSALRLERIDGLRLHVSGVDLLDGTPILDIKPYVPYTDAFADARSGWLADTASISPGAPDPISAFQVDFTPLALSQLSWIAAHSALALQDRVQSILSLGPQPHPYRRIRRTPDGYRLAVQDWRIAFEVTDRHVQVREVSSGYRAGQLEAGLPDPTGALAVHRAFLQAFALAPPGGR